MKARQLLQLVLIVEGVLIVFRSLWPAAAALGFVSSSMDGGDLLYFTLSLSWPGVAMIATGLVALMSHPDTMTRTGLVVELLVAGLAVIYLEAAFRPTIEPAVLYQAVFSSPIRMWIGALLIFNLAHTVIFHSSRGLKNTVIDMQAP